MRQKLKKTPKSSNSSGNNNNKRRTCPRLSQTNSTARKLFDSGEKDSPITKDSPLSEESSPSLSIDERDSFLTADGGESMNTCESGTDNVDEDENNKKKMMCWFPLFEGNRSN